MSTGETESLCGWIKLCIYHFATFCHLNTIYMHQQLHSKLSWKKVAELYHISDSTAIEYVDNLCRGMIESYKDSNIVSFPSEQQRQHMMKLNKMRGKPMAHAIYSMDGKHARYDSQFFRQQMHFNNTMFRCEGIHIKHRLSHKYHFFPCFNALFVSEVCIYILFLQCCVLCGNLFQEDLWNHHLLQFRRICNQA